MAGHGSPPGPERDGEAGARGPHGPSRERSVPGGPGPAGRVPAGPRGRADQQARLKAVFVTEAPCFGSTAMPEEVGISARKSMSK